MYARWRKRAAGLCSVSTSTSSAPKHELFMYSFGFSLDLDHTDDVQLHSWGDLLEEAFEQCAMATFGYMTETVEPIDTVEVESEGLFKLSADIFFIPRVRAFNIIMISHVSQWGEEFSLVKHPQGTEVKAITYSAMQVHDIDKPEIFAIIDI
uniref:Protein archease n=1 Tax=Oncorhynchus tshawytscha TaxID=74940 RepID=A0A8C8CY73_ONCTS